MRQSHEGTATGAAERAFWGAQAVMFLALCLIWTYDGAFLVVGTRLSPYWPSALQTACFLLVAGVLLANRCSWLNSLGRIVYDQSRLAYVALAVVYLAVLTFGSLHILTPIAAAVALVLLVVALWVDPRLQDMASPAMVSVLALYVAICRMVKVPLESLFHGTQLHVVYAACVEFLSGANPYRFYDMPINSALNYFPSLWLPYAPFVRAGVDMRWGNIAALIVLLVIGFVLQRRLWLVRGRQAQMVGLICFAGIFLNAGFIEDLVNLQVAPDWAFLSTMALGVAIGSPALGAVGLGLSLAARQTTIAVFPIAWIVFRRLFPRGSRYAMGAAFGSAALVLVFFLRDPAAFFQSVVLFTQSWGPGRWQFDQVQNSLISVSGPFYQSGLDRFLQPLQAIFVGGLTLLLARIRIDKPAAGIAAIALIYGVFILFNPMVWNVYWIQFVLLVLTMILSGMATGAPAAQPAADTDPVPLHRLRTELE